MIHSREDLTWPTLHSDTDISWFRFPVKRKPDLTRRPPLRIYAVWAAIVIPDQIIGLFPRGLTVLQFLGPAGFPILVFFVSPMAVAVSSVWMAVSAASAVSVKETEPEQVYQQPRGTHRDHHHGLFYLMWLGKALDGLQDDGETERGEEHGVHQRAHHLGPDPPERVLVGGLGLFGEAHRHQRHDQRDNVRQHMKRVRQHRKRRRDPADHHLHDEKAEGER